MVRVEAWFDQRGLLQFATVLQVGRDAGGPIRLLPVANTGEPHHMSQLHRQTDRQYSASSTAQTETATQQQRAARQVISVSWGTAVVALAARAHCGDDKQAGLVPHNPCAILPAHLTTKVVTASIRPFGLGGAAEYPFLWLSVTHYATVLARLGGLLLKRREDEPWLEGPHSSP